jgi:hypothetical protein
MGINQSEKVVILICTIPYPEFGKFVLSGIQFPSWSHIFTLSLAPPARLRTGTAANPLRVILSRITPLLTTLWTPTPIYYC